MLTLEQLIWIAVLAAYLTLGNMIWNSQMAVIVKSTDSPAYIFTMKWVTRLLWIVAVLYVLITAKKR